MRSIFPCAAGVLAAAVLASPALAQQVKSGAESGTGLTGADVPQLLKDIKAEPYRTPGPPVCDTVPVEIKQIDELIGPDLDDQTKHDDKSLASKGANMARDLVPYRGVVRFVTGANKKDDELRDAVMAGYARRGFLRGVQLNMKCGAQAESAATAAQPASATSKLKGKARPHKG
jgi:hypothetical protein